MKYSFKFAKKAVTTMFNGRISMTNKSSQGHSSKLFSSLIVFGLLGALVSIPDTTYSNHANPDKNKFENTAIEIQKIRTSSHILADEQPVALTDNSVEALQSDYLKKSNNSWRNDSAETSAELVNEDNLEEPNRFQLKQNYPNPFNPATEITYKLPVSRHVVLKVYDMLGRPIKTLVNDNQEAGNYTIRFNAGSLSSGMYIYRLEAGNYEQIRKMILIKYYFTQKNDRYPSYTFTDKKNGDIPTI